MSLTLSVTTEGGEKVIAVLDDTQARMLDLRPAFEGIADQIYDEETHIFHADGAYRGRAAWPALSPKYAEQKAKSGAPSHILQLSQLFRESLTRRDAPDSLCEVSRDGLVIGSDRVVVHHEALYKRKRWVDKGKIRKGDRVSGIRMTQGGRITKYQVERGSDSSSRGKWIDVDKLGRRDVVVGWKRNWTGEMTQLRVIRRYAKRGTLYSIGALHHEGAGNLPERKALTVVDEQVAEWGEIIMRHLQGAGGGE